MKAPEVDYVRPRSLTQAVGLLSNASVEARVIAGGQSLMAMMNLRLATPRLLIDIARLPELISATDDADAVTFGACVTHAAIEDDRFPDPSRGLMPRVATTLAYRAIRTRGTIGGAELTLLGPSGRRSLKCADFTTGIFETRLAADEIIESVRVAKLSANARWGYLKLSRKSGEFATALAVVVADPGRGRSRVVIGAANGAPLVLKDTGELVAAGRRDGEGLRSAVTADLERATDRHFDDFQRNLHTVAATRAVQQVLM